jgi:glycosyltransferase involved in cell wall biosynthesis
VETINTGLSWESLRLDSLRCSRSTICGLHPDVVHFTGPHLWNVPLVRTLVAQETPVVHTLHDLDPHYGTSYGSLLKAWNWLVIRSAHHILVHGQTYRQRLLDSGLSPDRVTWTPLLHLFLGSTKLTSSHDLTTSVEYQPWALFFGRLERYKGIEHLITAGAMMNGADSPTPRVVLAGPGHLATMWAGPLPQRVELRSRLIPDTEAIELFRRCGLLVLPYVDATQSALIAAAYYFRKPVVVTRTGALPEYVADGLTGCVVEPGHPAALARCLDEMLNDSARLARMGTAGRAWYESHRAAEERTLIEMYRRLTQTRPADDPIIQLSDHPI